VKALHRKSREVARMIGAKGIRIETFPDNRFDTVPLLDVVKVVEEEVEAVEPSTVYTHHGGDLNIDHQITHRALVTATRPTPRQVVRDVYAFEIPSSTEWAFHRSEAIFRPNVFVDISKTLELKIGALSRYDTEVREFPHPRSARALEAIARRWGTVVGCDAAEAFELVRSIR
jgi:LmbE family N-acetylglucosaminyl deacetylase